MEPLLYPAEEYFFFSQSFSSTAALMSSRMLLRHLHSLPWLPCWEGRNPASPL
ncbi:unnamed protein product, partial [Bubo scandiacus]